MVFMWGNDLYPGTATKIKHAYNLVPMQKQCI